MLVLTLIEIAAPIILIVSLGIIFIKLLSNPDDKNGVKKIFNAIFSCSIIFLLPVSVNLTMSLFGTNYTFSECWNSAYTSTGSSRFIQREDSEGKTPTKVYIEPDEYEKGSSGIELLLLKIKLLIILVILAIYGSELVILV